MKKNAFRKRFDFSKIPATIQIPNLIEAEGPPSGSQWTGCPASAMTPDFRPSSSRCFHHRFPQRITTEFVDYAIGNWGVQMWSPQGLASLAHHFQELRPTVITDPFHPGDVLARSAARTTRTLLISATSAATLLACN
jgi:DNA-directed RNA polymerase subunit beta